MSSEEKIDDIIARLGAIEKVLDELGDSMDTVTTSFDDLTAILKSLPDLINDQPNRTGTTLEKNQQIIWEGIASIKKALEKIELGEETE